MGDLGRNILKASDTALVDSSCDSLDWLRPSFVFNDHGSGLKVLSSLTDELRDCDEFFINVAFITEGGITPLLQDLKELESKGVMGKVLTTNYLSFSEPSALRKLDSLGNVEVRMFDSLGDNPGLHAKCYIFRKSGVYRVIMGSSNLTLSALTLNKEWNVALSSLENGELIKNILVEFNNLWDNSEVLSDFIDEYESVYDFNKRNRSQSQLIDEQDIELVPNSMQLDFMHNMDELWALDDRGLLISATGTGKTYASAFEVYNRDVKRLLFLVHREQIAKQAMASYKQIFKNTRSFGLISGNSREWDKDFIFSTMQMMSKEEIYTRFSPSEFDYIIIDEVHRAGAPSYQRIMDYFKPRFYLGMTASPDRPDGFDIYSLFHNNIAYEIRLQTALEENLLCPFHYFGISDIEIDGETITDDDKKLQDFNKLASDKRVDHIIEKAEYYGYSGERVKGLIFCSRTEEAQLLSDKFNERNYKTAVLTGEHSQEQREQTIKKLITDNTDEPYLDYIFTVDIFNEGVDIPEINQVIMLRPTQSTIIFIQQLGRGLRKYTNKEYLIVIDFIGNYTNNFMIPLALSGDRTHNKDTLRKYIQEGNRIIKGSSTIHFDNISKKRIYQSINDTNFATLKFLKENYQQLKHKIGKQPTLLDFYENGEIDPQLILQYSKTYTQFLKKVEPEYHTTLSPYEENILQAISQKITQSKRPHEAKILEKLLTQKTITINNPTPTIKSAIRFLKLEFETNKEKTKYHNIQLIQENNNNTLTLHPHLIKLLQNKEFQTQTQDIITYTLKNTKNKYKNTYQDTNLCLYEKYSRRDACHLLNWQKDESSTLYGYKTKHQTCPIFVTYEKHKDINPSIQYQEEFINKKTFSWMTRNPRTLESPEIQEIINHQKNNTQLHLFIKKSDGEGRDFYYLGKVTPTQAKQTLMKDNNHKDTPVVNFQLKLDQPVKEDIYNYLIN